jgi:hypothetical protein
MEVYVSVYEHRHGTDVSVHRSEQLAIGAAAEIAREWWGEARERDETLPARPPSSDAEAISLYFEAQEGFEFHQIRRCEVAGLEPALAGAGAGG